MLWSKYTYQREQNAIGKCSDAPHLELLIHKVTKTHINTSIFVNLKSSDAQIEAKILVI